MSPHLPVTADEIADQTIAAAQAGAAVLHLHARDPEDGRPDQSVAAFAPILRKIRAHTDAVLNITTGGAPTMSVTERMQPAARYKPELASLNMGTMNFGLFPMLDRYKDQLKYQWEQDYLGNRDIVFRNTFADIEHIMRSLGANGTRFEFECYDTAHLYNLKYFHDQGLVQGPLFIQTVFGLMGGIGAHAEDVQHMKRTADPLFGADCRWSTSGPGATSCPSRRSRRQMAAMSASGWKTISGLGGGVWPKATWGRSAPCARSSKGLASPSRPLTRPGRSSRSKVGRRSMPEARGPRLEAAMACMGKNRPAP